MRLVERAVEMGLRPKPEVGIQFGAGGAASAERLEALGPRDAGWVVRMAERLLEAGADRVMIESEGTTENERACGTDLIGEIVTALGLPKVMFEAAEPDVFVVREDIRTRGESVCRSQPDRAARVQPPGNRGTAEVWGRVVSYRPAP